jgi:hypothetical protein
MFDVRGHPNGTKEPLVVGALGEIEVAVSEQFEQHAPAYEFGSTCAANPRFKDREWTLSSRKCGAIGRHVAKVPGKHSKIRSVTGGIKCAVGALPNVAPCSLA